jgi:hypothetical protein
MEQFTAHLRVLLMTTIVLKRQLVYRTLFHFNLHMLMIFFLRA